MIQLITHLIIKVEAAAIFHITYAFIRNRKRKFIDALHSSLSSAQSRTKLDFFLKGETYMSVLKYVQNNTTKSYFYHSSFMCMPQFLQADQKHFWQETVTL